MMVVQGFAAMKGAVLSFMASMGPMLALTAILYGVMKVFQAYSERNKQVEERTKELTSAIKNQVDAMKKNKEALGEYLSSTGELGTILAETGEDGEKLTKALHILGQAQSDAIPTLVAMKGAVEETAYEIAKSNGVTEEQARLIAQNVKYYESSAGVITGILPEYQELALQLEEINDQAEKTDMKKFVDAHLDSVYAIGKEEAALVKATRATVEKDFASRGLADTDEMYMEILKQTGDALRKMADKTKVSEVATSKAAMVTKSMVQRLQEMKAAADDGKFSVEEMSKALYGVEVFEGVKVARQFLEMRESMTGLIDGIEAQ